MAQKLNPGAELVIDSKSGGLTLLTRHHFRALLKVTGGELQLGGAESLNRAGVP